MKRFAIFVLLLAIFVGAVLSTKNEGTAFSQNNICLILQIEPDGKITQEFTFPLQKEKLKALNVSDEKIDQILTSLRNNVGAIRDEFLISHMISYNLNPQPQFKFGEGLIITNASYSNQSDMVGFDIIYQNQEAWQYYHGKDEEKIENDNEIKFLTKTVSETIFPFSSKMQVSGDEIYVGQRYKGIYLQAFSDYLLPEQLNKLEMPNFVYDYSFPSNRLKTNCDFKQTVGRQTHYIWVRDENSYITLNKVTFSLCRANAGLWILTLLGAVLTITTLLTVVFLVSDHLKAKKVKQFS